MKKKFEEPKPLTEGMMQGLARMYADSYMRDYLGNAIAIAKKNALTLLGVGKNEEARDYLSRARSLEQLLEKGRMNFVYFENIKKSKDPLVGYRIEEVKL